MTPDDRLPAQPGFEDLGEASFYPALLVPACLLISPLGAFPPLAVILGAVLLFISLQMSFRLPCLSVPSVFQDPIIKTALFQRMVEKHRERQADTSTRRRQGHWGTLPPFDIVPRVLIGIVGGIAIFGSGLPGLPMVMGLAALLITLSLIFRSILSLLCGAATLSLSSLIPILSS